MLETRLALVDSAQSCGELEAEVNSKGLVEFGDKRWRQSADPLTYPFDSYGPDLFRLRF
jgi:hypothetical protein